MKILRKGVFLAAALGALTWSGMNWNVEVHSRRSRTTALVRSSAEMCGRKRFRIASVRRAGACRRTRAPREGRSYSPCASALEHSSCAQRKEHGVVLGGRRATYRK